MVHKIVQGMGGYLWLGLFLLISFMVIRSIYNVSISRFDWAKAYYRDRANYNHILFWNNLKWVLIGSSFQFMKTWVVFIGLTWFCRNLHALMIFRLLHAKVAEYLQRTPFGVILNRFSNDVNELDVNFANTLNGTATFLFNITIDFYSLIKVNSVFGTVPLVLAFFFGFWIRKVYLSGYRELIRLDFISRSPVIGLASCAIPGGPVIRCLGIQDYFSKKLTHRINENTKNNLMIRGMKRWLSVNMHSFNCLCLILPSYGFLLYKLYTTYDEADADYSAISFFIGRTLGFSYNLITFLLLVADVELNCISAERCFEFGEIIPETGYKHIDRDMQIFEKPKRDLELANQTASQFKKKNYITEGHIEFEHIVASYPTSTRPVINDVNITILPGQKVGIVGRTGAGKSSFIKLIWRALNPSMGAIRVDGININDTDLKEYRDQLTIILQKPNIFEGTIASNISQIPLPISRLNAIRNEMIDLGFPRDKLMESDLSFKVETSGSNLSQSEKQIICLMQSLQKKSKIVILDEATAYVDVEVEKKFQDKIAEGFAESTMFIIAHRISNVMKCDRILVFEKGVVIQDGSPNELLQDKNCAFYGICSKR